MFISYLHKIQMTLKSKIIFLLLKKEWIYKNREFSEDSRQFYAWQLNCQWYQNISIEIFEWFLWIYNEKNMIGY